MKPPAPRPRAWRASILRTTTRIVPPNENGLGAVSSAQAGYRRFDRFPGRTGAPNPWRGAVKRPTLASGHRYGTSNGTGATIAGTVHDRGCGSCQVTTCAWPVVAATKQG